MVLKWCISLSSRDSDRICPGSDSVCQLVQRLELLDDTQHFQKGGRRQPCAQEHRDVPTSQASCPTSQETALGFSATLAGREQDTKYLQNIKKLMFVNEHSIPGFLKIIHYEFSVLIWKLDTYSYFAILSVRLYTSCFFHNTRVNYDQANFK